MRNLLTTIFIPVYLGERYLDECIRSALAQDMSICRVVVLLGGGNDKSKQIAEKYVDQGVEIVDTIVDPNYQTII